MSGRLPGTDAHVLVVGADGRDLTLRLAARFTCAAGGPHIAELAQHFWLNYIGSC